MHYFIHLIHERMHYLQLEKSCLNPLTYLHFYGHENNGMKKNIVLHRFSCILASEILNNNIL